MTTMKLNIRQGKERFSEIINRVNFKGERVVLMSRNKPKAIIVGVSETGLFMDDPIRKARRLLQLEQIRSIRRRLACKGVKMDSGRDLKELREGTRPKPL